MKRVLFFSLTIALFSASCTKDSTENFNDKYLLADVDKGGIMYDRFWAASTGYDQTANADAVATMEASADFFRCKQCHAWDGLGNAGSYISRAPKAGASGRPNISSVNLIDFIANNSAEEVYNALAKKEGRRSLSADLSTYDPATNNTDGDKMPNLSEVLTESELMNLAKYLKEGMYDISDLAKLTTTGTYPTGSFSYSDWGFDADAAAGDAIWAKSCASCHAADGTMNADGSTIGKILRGKAYEFAQKARYGVHNKDGQTMPGTKLSLEEMKQLYKALADDSKYPNP